MRYSNGAVPKRRARSSGCIRAKQRNATQRNAMQCNAMQQAHTIPSLEQSAARTRGLTVHEREGDQSFIKHGGRRAHALIVTCVESGQPDTEKKKKKKDI